MKQIFSILFIVCVLHTVPYKTFAQVYLRLYDSTGKKIGKGYISAVSDSTVQLKSAIVRTINIRQVQYIKTKLSCGSSVLKGSIAGLMCSLLIIKFNGVPADADTNSVFITKQQGIILIAGTATGTLIGFISGITQKRQKIFINGNPEKWKIERGKFEFN